MASSFERFQSYLSDEPPSLGPSAGPPSGPSKGYSFGRFQSYLGEPPAESTAATAWRRSGIPQALDLLGRPAQAVAGALAAESTPEKAHAAAAWRGFTGRERFPSVGEQTLPDRPEASDAENWLRTVGRFGLDVTTDPTTYIGAGAVKGVGAAVGRPIAKVASKLKLPQGIARYASPVKEVLTRYGGRAGKRAAVDIADYHARASIRSAGAAQEFTEVLSKLGLAGRGAEPTLIAADDLVRAGAIGTHPDKRVNDLATWLKQTFDKVGAEATSFRDPLGRGFEIADPLKRAFQADATKYARKLGLAPSEMRDAFQAATSGISAPGATGKLAGWLRRNGVRRGIAIDPADPVFAGKTFWRTPFKPTTNYAPQIPTEDFMSQLRSVRGRGKAIRDYAAANGISESEAEGILGKFGGPRRASSLEFARVGNAPFERNPAKYLPQYLERTFDRMEFARTFGVGGKRWDRLMDAAVKSGLDRDYARGLRDVVMGRQPSDPVLEGIAHKLVGAQVVTKMGPLSTIANLSQNLNTIVRDGGINFVKGILRATTPEGARAGAIAYHQALRNSLEGMASGQRTIAAKYLSATGFTWAEKLNRLLGANAGIVAAESEMARGGGRLTAGLIKRGVNGNDVADFARLGKFTPDALDRIGLKAAEATQFATHYQDLPLFWRSPWARVALQYKTFAYNQTRFMTNEVLKPALKSWATGGKEGDARPFLRAAAAFGIGAPILAELRRGARQLAGREPERSDDPTLQYVQDLFAMGALGVAGDLAERATRRGVLAWMVGPTVSDAAEGAEGIADVVKDAYNESDLNLGERAGRAAIRRVPFVGQFTGGGERGVEAAKTSFERFQDFLR